MNITWDQLAYNDIDISLDLYVNKWNATASGYMDAFLLRITENVSASAGFYLAEPFPSSLQTSCSYYIVPTVITPNDDDIFMNNLHNGSYFRITGRMYFYNHIVFFFVGSIARL